MLFKPETSYSILRDVFSVGDLNIVYTYILLWGDDKLGNTCTVNDRLFS